MKKKAAKLAAKNEAEETKKDPEQNAKDPTTQETKEEEIVQPLPDDGLM